VPPRSYIITAAILVVLVFISLPLTMGFSILLWYWLFAAAACILAVAGAFKVTNGLGAPLWIAIALASPGFVWAVNKLYEMPFLPSPGSAITFYVAAFMALLAAGVGALRLIEMMSRSHTAFRVGYGILAAAALIIGRRPGRPCHGVEFHDRRALPLKLAGVVLFGRTGQIRCVHRGGDADYPASRHRALDRHRDQSGQCLHALQGFKAVVCG
jgi:hypothetical protein